MMVKASSITSFDVSTYLRHDFNNTNHDNTAIGVEALKANTQGQDNTAHRCLGAR